MPLPEMRTWWVWSTFCLFGASSLFAWNTWITADAFFRIRLQGSPYSDSFQSWFASTYFWFNLGSLGLLLIVPASPRRKLVAGFILSATVFLVAAIMATVAGRLDASVYFVITLMLVVLSSVASALTMSAYGLVAEYTPICSQAMTTGMVTLIVIHSCRYTYINISRISNRESPVSCPPSLHW